MSKAPSSSLTVYYTYTITIILLLGKIMPFLYSYCAKEGLVYITLASPSLRQPSSCLECTKANICSSYDVRSVFNAKYTRYITLNSY